MDPAPSSFLIETKGDELEAEGINSKSKELEDKGPSSRSEEAAFEDQQQQTVPVKDTTADESFGLGYGAARRCSLELEESLVPSTYEI
ncbi:hypothetical protein Tco_0051760 [Tanacetum coccineum]